MKKKLLLSEHSLDYKKSLKAVNKFQTREKSETERKQN